MFRTIEGILHITKGFPLIQEMIPKAGELFNDLVDDWRQQFHLS